MGKVSRRKIPIDWHPKKYITDCCNDIIWSRYPGAYTECKCGENFVDEHVGYLRCGRGVKSLNTTPLGKALEEK